MKRSIKRYRRRLLNKARSITARKLGRARSKLPRFITNKLYRNSRNRI